MGSEDGSPKGDKTQLQQQDKESYSQKRMHSGFMRVAEEVIDNKNGWLRMKKRYPKKETQGLIMATQDQSLITRWVKHYTDRNWYPEMQNM